MNEKTALARLRRGDEQALEWFVERYTPYVGAIVWSIVGSRLSVQDGEEITADVFLTLWRNRTKPHGGMVKSYLGAIARSRAIDRLRRETDQPELEFDELDMAVEGPERDVLAREDRIQLLAAVDALGPPDREIFLRHYYCEQTAPEIGALLGMTPEAVRQRLKRGRELLRRTLMKGAYKDEDIGVV